MANKNLLALGRVHDPKNLRNLVLWKCEYFDAITSPFSRYYGRVSTKSSIRKYTSGYFKSIFSRKEIPFLVVLNEAASQTMARYKLFNFTK